MPGKTENRIKIGIIGASGLTAGILLKLLANHKYADVVCWYQIVNLI